MRKSTAQDLSGKRFGRLTVSNRVKSKRYGITRWFCLCDCGGTKETDAGNLRSGDTKSCGCLEKEAKQQNTRTHGLTSGKKHHPLYRKWASIKERCTNPNYKFWDRYGGRGITLCDEWINNPKAFYEFMGEKPFEKAEIDRIDNDGNYEPSNVRWSNRKENCRNTSARRTYTYNGVAKSISEWADEWGLEIGKIRTRIIRGWSKEDILNIPTFKKGGKRCAIRS